MIPLGARWSLLLALGSGVLLWLAFPPVGFGPYAAVAVALLTLAQVRVSVRRGLLTGLVAGLAFFAGLLFWLRIVGPDAWLGLALFCALWFALMGAGTALVTRLPGWPVWVAALWVLQEALRGSVPFGGFPWGRLAFAQPDTAFGRAASIVGQPGTTFIVALVGTSVVAGVLAFARSRRIAGSWIAVAVIGTVGCALTPLASVGDTVGGPTSMPIAVVQGGTPQTGMGAMDVRRAVLDNHVTQTLLLAKSIDAGAAPQPAFVLWPENSTDIDPFVDPAAAAEISYAAKAVGVPILVGAVVEVPGNPYGIWNLGVLWDPVSGPGPRYVKRHPVPFGEYIPMRAQIASLIGRFDRIPRDFVPGTRPGLFDIDGTWIGDVICFEVAYDDVVHPLLASRARVITVQTNNATYGGTAQPEQQLLIERMRAIEGGRSVVVAATTGVSAFIGPDGEVMESMAQGEVGGRVLEVPLRGAPTVATRLGDVPETVLSLIAFGAVVWGIVVAVRARRSRRPKVDG